MIKRILCYSVSDDKTELHMKYTEHRLGLIANIEKDYNLIEFDNVSLYNTIIKDLDAEYDNQLADMIDEMVNVVIKKGSE